MSLVRKIYIDSRTCSGSLADFAATLPEPIRADPTLGVILSQLTFVNNFETVMQDYTNRCTSPWTWATPMAWCRLISTIASTCALSMTQKLDPTIGSS